MGNDAVLLYAKGAITEKWESEERGSYDVDALHQEYRQRLYSEKAFALMNVCSEKSPE